MPVGIGEPIHHRGLLGFVGVVVVVVVVVIVVIVVVVEVIIGGVVVVVGDGGELVFVGDRSACRPHPAESPPNRRGSVGIGDVLVVLVDGGGGSDLVVVFQYTTIVQFVDRFFLRPVPCQTVVTLVLRTSDVGTHLLFKFFRQY